MYADMAFFTGVLGDFQLVCLIKYYVLFHLHLADLCCSRVSDFKSNLSVAYESFVVPLCVT